jgi:hypothetical protein
MPHRPMTISQHSAMPAAADWRLAAGQARRLKIGPGPRALQMLEGRLWLTARAQAGTPPPDLWLQAGETLRLADGSQWVIEAWGEARFQLLVPPEACMTPTQRLRTWWAERRSPGQRLPALRAL